MHQNMLLKQYIKLSLNSVLNMISHSFSAVIREISLVNKVFPHTQAKFKRRLTCHVPNLIVMTKSLCLGPFTFDSAHEKFDV